MKSQLNKLRKAIGRELQEIRGKCDATQTEFVRIFNMFEPKELTLNQADISRYEDGKVDMPGTKLEKFRIIGGLMDLQVEKLRKERDNNIKRIKGETL